MSAFAGRSVLVTGGTRGIGKAIAVRFARLGAARVAVGYLRNDRAAEETAEELRAAGAEPVLVRGNVASEDKHWDWTMAANARALLSLARACAREMAPGSAIVGVSSLGSVRVLENYVLVGASKAALESVVRYLAVELAPLGIRVNAVSAGVVETGALDYFPNKDEMLRSSLERTPVGRLVEPADIAAAVTFLCSPDAEMVRGHTLVVDGGYSLLA
jgi:enoyl-[acyl-carrier protein] reductase III